MSSNWWAGKLNGQPGVPTPPPAPAPMPGPYNPVPQPQYPTQMPSQTYQQSPEASRASGRCPSCGSGNYGSSMLAPEAKARCYDCGYPVVQSGSGMGTGVGQSTGGPAVPARQINTANNFNPQTIIGHI
jgi:hypothetical protein